MGLVRWAWLVASDQMLVHAYPWLLVLVPDGIGVLAADPDGFGTLVCAGLILG